MKPAMVLPTKFVKENMELADGTLFMGHKISDLSRDELIAVAVAGWRAEQKAREEGMRRVKFMASL